jgi:uncharacterized protein (TIGR02391 family)
MERLFTASELEAIAQALADTSEGLTGTEIGHLLETLKMSDPDPTMTKWKRLHNAFAARQNHAQNRRAILQLIREAMKPERYARTPERFEPMRANVNRALAFAGLVVDAAGKLSEVARAQTLPEAIRRAQELRDDLVSRGVHPDVLRFCRAELVADNYFHAVLEASKSVADKLRARSGFTEDGGELVDRALCGAAPKIRLNPLTTESQKSEQKGFANLVKGTFGMFRNPTAHEARILWTMAKEDAEDLLSLASMIHRRLDAATVAP